MLARSYSESSASRPSPRPWRLWHRSPHWARSSRSTPTRPAISRGRGCAGDGDVIVVWESAGQASPQLDVFARLFGRDGAPKTPEIPVNSYTTGSENSADVASDPDGNFVVVWQSFSEDGSGFGIVGRRFDPNGVPLGGDFVANQYTEYNQVGPSISMTSAGAFVVVWESPHDGDQSGIFGRRFDASGARLGDEFVLNTYAEGNTVSPDASIDPAGQFVVAWHNVTPNGSFGVFARRGGFPDARPMAVDARAGSAASNVNGVLETGETVAVDPSWRNASATADCLEVSITGARPSPHWDASKQFAVFPASITP